MFSSERLSYRKLCEGDWQLFFDLNTNKEVMKYAYLDEFKTIEAAKAAFQKVLQLQIEEDQGTQYVAIQKSDQVAIGMVDYDVHLKRQEGGVYEIGYFIKPSYWGCGYGTEMGKALIKFLFETSNIHKVVASCNGNNASSEGIMKKLGMRKEGVFRQSRFKNGSWADEIKYGLLRDEYYN